MAEQESVRPFQGKWRQVELPEGVGEMWQDGFMIGLVDQHYYRRCALAVSIGARRHLSGLAGGTAVTLLTRFMIDVPRPGDTDPGAYRRALEETLGLLGVTLMLTGNDPSPMEAEGAVLSNALGTPGKIFDRAVLGRNRASAEQARRPLGVGYATSRRVNQARGFLLGICNPCADPDDPTGGFGGWRSELWVDVAKIQEEYPALRPVPMVYPLHRSLPNAAPRDNSRQDVSYPYPLRSHSPGVASWR